MASISQLSELAYSQSSTHLDKGVQAVPYPESRGSISSPSRTSSPAVKVLPKPPTLAIPPALNFDTEAIQWKGLTLEAAQWTFSSSELQDIVSRAIRKSAHESFIKLLSVKTMDEELVKEVERLDTLRLTTQSQYRFNMHRRTMFLQSLVSLSSGDGDYTALGNLAKQLSEITAACDRLMESMLRISDQRAQIQRIQEVHDASALAMALRKLNGSYAKRTSELKELRSQNDQLKAELEEAWRVAEEMAQEMDDLDNFQTGFSEGDGEGEGDGEVPAPEGAEDVPANAPPDDPEADGEGDFLGVDEDLLVDASVRLAKVINITGTAVATKATLTNLPDDRSIRSGTDRASRVSAARRRSSRTSKASLRIPRSQQSGSQGDRPPSVFSRKRSLSRGKSIRRGTEDSLSVSDVPPVPGPSNLHLDTGLAAPKDSSFLELAETRPGSPVTPETPPQLPPKPQVLADSPTAIDALEKIRPTTMALDLPPINISSPVEGSDDVHDQLLQPESGENDLSMMRRVQSMAPPPRITRSQDDSDVNTSSRSGPSSSAGLKRSSSINDKKFDGWPWATLGAGRKSKRTSLPMTRVSLESAKKNMKMAASPLSKSTNHSVESVP